MKSSKESEILNSPILVLQSIGFILRIQNIIHVVVVDRDVIRQIIRPMLCAIYREHRATHITKLIFVLDRMLESLLIDELKGNEENWRYDGDDLEQFAQLMERYQQMSHETSVTKYEN